MGYPAVGAGSPTRVCPSAANNAKYTEPAGIGTEATRSEENVDKPAEKGKLKKFFKTAKKNGMEVVPEPNGRPIFLFFAAKGRNKPVQVFFDNGCSDAVMREGIPGLNGEVS